MVKKVNFMFLPEFKKYIKNIFKNFKGRMNAAKL